MASSATAVNPEEIKRSIGLLIEPGDVHELRVLKAGRNRTISGYYNDSGKLAEAIAELSGKAEGIYLTLNPASPALLARAENRWKPYADTLTTDNDILRRKWLLVDIDPTRPAGISSSDPEKEAARATAREVRDYLTQRGWPLPIAMDSGNGYHLRYRVELPNDKESTQLVKDCLEALAAKFNGDVVKVDKSVFNASRIAKAPGSLAAKGDSTTERPHRIARLLKVNGERVGVVPLDLLQALAAEAPKQEQVKRAASSGAKIAPDKVEKFMAHYSIEHSEPKRTTAGLMWILRPCPLNESHTGTSSAIILRDDGTMCWACKHDSCQMTWKEFRQTLEEMHPDKPKFHFLEKGKTSNHANKGGTEDVSADDASEDRPPKAWNELADELDELRTGTGDVVDENGNAAKVRLPRHIVEESIFQFVLAAFRERAKMFFDAYPYLYLPAEEQIIRFHDDREVYGLLARLRLRLTQKDARLVKENLALHILTRGEATQVERWGCFRNDAVYVNNGRKGMFKITIRAIEEVPNGTDGVYMLDNEVLPWPEMNDENAMLMRTISHGLGNFGMKVTEGSWLCQHLNAVFDPQVLTPAQYQQLFLTRYLSLFLTGYSKLRPIIMALGEQNSGKSTLFEKIMWLIAGLGYESEGLPKDLRGLLAAITNHHIKVFDNIDGADVDELGYADYFCKAATGGTVSIAQLYETNVDRMYGLRCDLFFTSRYNPWPSHRSDLSRRTLFFPIRKPAQHEYRTVESMQMALWQDRTAMLLETLVRLQKVLRALLAKSGKEYAPISEMHSYETYTMRVADYEGWADGMAAIWKGYFRDYQERVTEYSPIVDEIRKWLGCPGPDKKYPNANRWVKASELFKDIKALGGRDCTWKNESTFGRAVEKHFSALRVLGIDKKKLGGVKMLKFSPDSEQTDMCKTAYAASGARLYNFLEETIPEDVI